LSKPKQVKKGEQPENPQHELALFFYRKLLFALYAEIGALQPHHHEEIARKADLTHGFFQREREKQAGQIYHRTVHLTDPAAIEEPYRDRTGLSLEDVHQAFAEGNWKNKFQAYSLGGPRWAGIAEKTLELRDVIQRGDWDRVQTLTLEIKGMKHNQGYLVDLFDRTERYQ